MTDRELFLKHIGQTSLSPLGLEIVKAEGAILYDRKGRELIDLIGGINVANIGHRHPRVVQAIRDQIGHYLHLMVYGEFVETPQVKYAKLLVDHLPSSLNSVYFTNSGTEATEGAMKLAKRLTNRAGIISFNNSYHGSTQGALSVIGSEYWRNAFRPLLPGVAHFNYNSPEAISAINKDTACVIMETVQGEAGLIVPANDWIGAIRNKCTETGALLILDEIQTGFGRTGKLWAFEHFNIVPDILLLGKALGGGMPLGAFITDRALMMALTENPELGHITTFGGHPVCCAAGLAAMKALLEEDLIKQVHHKEQLFRELLGDNKIRSLRSFGLWLAAEFDSFATNRNVIQHCISNGVLVDWFLFASNCLRIAPPLVISDDQIESACKILVTALR